MSWRKISTEGSGLLVRLETTMMTSAEAAAAYMNHPDWASLYGEADLTWADPSQRRTSFTGWFCGIST